MVCAGIVSPREREMRLSRFCNSSGSDESVESYGDWRVNEWSGYTK